MSKQTQSEEQGKKTSKKKYVVLAIIVLLAVLGTVMNNRSEGGKVSVSKSEVATNVTEKQPNEEVTVARIDVTTSLVNADKPQFEVYVDGADTPAKQARWMPKMGKQGVVVQKDSGSTDIVLKSLTNNEIVLLLKGPWKKDKNGKMIKHWVKYTTFLINNNEVLEKPVTVWHNENFKYAITPKINEEYKIHIEWQKPSEE